MNTDFELNQQARNLVRYLRRNHPDRLRFLATGFLRVTECTLGGHCHCGKPIEERGTLFQPGQLLEAIQHHADGMRQHIHEMEQRLYESVRAQCPPGHVIDQAVTEELGLDGASVEALQTLIDRVAAAVPVAAESLVSESLRT